MSQKGTIPRLWRAGTTQGSLLLLVSECRWLACVIIFFTESKQKTVPGTKVQLEEAVLASSTRWEFLFAETKKPVLRGHSELLMVGSPGFPLFLLFSDFFSLSSFVFLGSCMVHVVVSL